jgi:hypothetical protein
MEHQDDHEKLVSDLRAGSVRRDRELGKLLWHGSHDAPLVQRIGVSLLGLWLFMMGIVAESMAFRKTAYKPDAPILVIMALIPFYLGVRLIRNAFLKRS